MKTKQQPPKRTADDFAIGDEVRHLAWPLEHPPGVVVGFTTSSGKKALKVEHDGNTWIHPPEHMEPAS